MPDHLICYDITDPKRLVRMHRALKREAMALQYSVFLFTGSERQLDTLLSRLRQMIDPRHDDVRAYPLPQRGERLRLGKSLLPAGIQWSALPAAWREEGEFVSQTPR
jgi:CRISPR-associated protein Cas2